MVRLAWFAAASAGLAVGLAVRTPVAHAQQGREAATSTPRAVAALSPDTVKVGDPFTLGLSVVGPSDADVRFPPLVTLGSELEQLRPVDVEWDAAGGGRWRARYRLAAWKAGTWDIPEVQLDWQGSQLSLVPPAVHVTSVLPAASEGPLPLEGPWGPRRVRSFPWWLLLLLLALALLWWLLRRLRRTEDLEETEWVDPAVEAREALARLKRDLEHNGVDLAAFYDGLEEVLRRYLAGRRDWPRERPVREFVGEAIVAEDREDEKVSLRSLQDRAGLVRFAHVTAADAAALDDVDACLAWVEAEEEAA